MTKDEIIQLAEDCGIAHQYYEIKVGKKIVTVESCTGRLLKFAKLVEEIEREAILKYLINERVLFEEGVVARGIRGLEHHG